MVLFEGKMPIWIISSLLIFKPGCSAEFVYTSELRALPYQPSCCKLHCGIISNIAPPEVSRDQPISYQVASSAPGSPAQVMITSDFLHLGTNKLSPTRRGNTMIPLPCPRLCRYSMSSQKSPQSIVFSMLLAGVVQCCHPRLFPPICLLS